jgi:hypothetical protein
MARAVTLSATFGAGGTMIGPALAERLGLPFADRLIPNRDRHPAQSREGLTEAEREEEPPSPLLEGLTLLGGGMSLPIPAEAPLIPEQFKSQVEDSLQQLLDGGGAVILGRAGAAALRGRPGVYHVRLDGPVEARARRGAQLDDVSSVEHAKQLLHSTDDVRNKYVKRLYHCDPADPKLYHLVLDSTALPIEVCVDLIATAAEAFWATTPA